MPGWTNVLNDPTPILAIFGGSAPSLQATDLHEIVLHRDGPCAMLRFDLSSFPAVPPAKWKASGYNRVQVRLQAIGVLSLTINGVQANCRMDLEVSRSESAISVRGNNGTVSINITSEELRVESISAYLDLATDPKT